ncbi:MAG: CCA tRNA nucleotidyltransferase [Alphaproteobacteria bacterium]|nr:CCA tRNA nucleotidyltransferase [Alphaproteobacteria bacterium]OJV13916.1 MAG: hypothetical protein BGO27_08485 [Alphaproteobacteria bacterium 33-17]
MINSKISSSISEFLQTPEILKFSKLFKNLENFRFVGGVVRNLIMGLKVSDYDIATIYKPEEVIEYCKSNNIPCKPTGLAHGTVTVIIDKIPFEITTLRIDIECDGRHATTAYTTSWEEDSSRRDFTINAMYLDFSGNIYDYHNGITDCNNRFVKFIGNPQARIEEDYLRILRLFRFWAIYGSEPIEKQTLDICRETSKYLNIISPERIKNELDKIIASPKFYETISILYEYKILDSLDYFKTIEIPKLSKEKLESPTLHRCYVYYILFHQNDSLLKDFPFSKIEKTTISDFHKFSDQPIEFALYYNGFEFAYATAMIKGDTSLTLQYQHTSTTLPVTNHDLISYGLKGSEISKTKKALEIKWIESKFKISKKSLLESIDN